MNTHRTLAAIGLAITATVTATVGAVALPAGTAAAATVVDCSAGPVTLTETYGEYQLVGTCSSVDIEAPDVTVSLTEASTITVNGVDAHVTTSGPVGSVSVVDTGSIITATSLGRAQLDGTGTDLTASDVRTLVVTGSQVHLRITSAHRATVSGTSGTLVLTRLSRLSVSGTSNTIRVKKGVTRVTDTGTHNHIRVHRRLPHHAHRGRR